MNESDCGRVFALLSEYLDQGLAPDTCKELEHHLSGCPTCMEFVQGWNLKRSMHLCRQSGMSQFPVYIGASRNGYMEDSGISFNLKARSHYRHVDDDRRYNRSENDRAAPRRLKTSTHGTVRLKRTCSCMSSKLKSWRLNVRGAAPCGVYGHT